MHSTVLELCDGVHIVIYKLKTTTANNVTIMVDGTSNERALLSLESDISLIQYSQYAPYLFIMNIGRLKNANMLSRYMREICKRMEASMTCVAI